MDMGRRKWIFARFDAQDRCVRMPWLKKTQETFTDLCTRCGECIRACPQSIIAKGEGGFPQIDFQRGECTFCQACTLVCSESLFDENLDTLPWATTVQIQNTCLTQQGVVCQSCQDACDVNAIRFHPRRGVVAQPHINNEICTGCGACVSYCPVNAMSVLHSEEKTGDIYCV